MNLRLKLQIYLITGDVKDRLYTATHTSPVILP
jgi:hypothetical protein